MSISERKHVSVGEAPARRVEIFTGAARRRSWRAHRRSRAVAAREARPHARSSASSARRANSPRRSAMRSRVGRALPGSSTTAESRSTPTRSSARSDPSPLVARMSSSPAPTAAAKTGAVVAPLVETCKLNGVDPHVYLADVLAKIVKGHLNSQIDDLLPWAT